MIELFEEYKKYKLSVKISEVINYSSDPKRDIMNLLVGNKIRFITNAYMVVPVAGMWGSEINKLNSKERKCKIQVTGKVEDVIFKYSHSPFEFYVKVSDDWVLTTVPDGYVDDLYYNFKKYRKEEVGRIRYLFLLWCDELFGDDPITFINKMTPASLKVYHSIFSKKDSPKFDL